MGVMSNQSSVNSKLNLSSVDVQLPELFCRLYCKQSRYYLLFFWGAASDLTPKSQCESQTSHGCHQALSRKKTAQSSKKLDSRVMDVLLDQVSGCLAVYFRGIDKKRVGMTLISDDSGQETWFGCRCELDKIQADCLLSQASVYRDQGCKIDLDCQMVNDFDAMKNHLCQLACRWHQVSAIVKEEKRIQQASNQALDANDGEGFQVRLKGFDGAFSQYFFRKNSSSDQPLNGNQGLRGSEPGSEINSEAQESSEEEADSFVMVARP